MCAEVLGQRRTQDLLIRAPARTATCEFAVNHDGRNAANAITLGLGCYFGLLHVMDQHLMRRTSKALYYLYCFLAGRATGAEYFDFLFCSLACFSPFFEFIKVLCSGIRGTLLLR